MPQGSAEEIVPKLCLKNGLDFPVISCEELKGLTSLKERLVALRLTFIQIRALGVDKQCGMKGNVVHIMNTLQETTHILPRRFDDASTIQVQLMRHMDHEKPYIFQTVRPFKILTAAKYLLGTPMYIEEGAVLSEGWENYVEDEMNSLTRDLRPCVNNFEDENDDGQEKMIMENQMAEVTRIAPGQGKKLSIHILRDEKIH
jgi:hypothetical protein